MQNKNWYHHIVHVYTTIFKAVLISTDQVDTKKPTEKVERLTISLETLAEQGVVKSPSLVMK